MACTESKPVHPCRAEVQTYLHPSLVAEVWKHVHATRLFAVGFADSSVMYTNVATVAVNVESPPAGSFLDLGSQQHYDRVGLRGTVETDVESGLNAVAAEAACIP